MVHLTSTTNPSTILSAIPLALVPFVSTLLPFIVVGKSSRHRDPAEVSGTFWNISLVYKFCNSLYLLTGLQRNMLYSKSNQPTTTFLWQLQITRTLDPTSPSLCIKSCYWGLSMYFTSHICPWTYSLSQSSSWHQASLAPLNYSLGHMEPSLSTPISSWGRLPSHHSGYPTATRALVDLLIIFRSVSCSHWQELIIANLW